MRNITRMTIRNVCNTNLLIGNSAHGIRGSNTLAIKILPSIIPIENKKETNTSKENRAKLSDEEASLYKL